MTQFDLFGNEVKTVFQAAKKARLISWSYSKMQTFRDCPRKYYFLYFGSKKKKALKEPLKEKLIELSHLSNRYMVQGDIIHKMISLFFKKSKQDQIWDLDRLTSFATLIVNETITHNVNVRNGIPVPIEKYPKDYIKELLNSMIGDDELKTGMLDIINNCLRNFFQSDRYQGIRIGGANSTSIIEGDTAFSIDDLVAVDGKVDLAYIENDKLIITDWKSGKKEFQDTSLQLLVYALWSRQLKEFNFKEVEIQKAYLIDGSLEKLEFSETHIDRARVRILQDAELLLEMDEYGRNAVKDAFAKHEGKNCKICPFEEICIKKTS